jgi:hypothetical protein
VPALPQNIHDPTDLVAAEQSLQPALPATSRRANPTATRRQLGAIHSKP